MSHNKRKLIAQRIEEDEDDFESDDSEEEEDEDEEEELVAAKPVGKKAASAADATAPTRAEIDAAGAKSTRYINKQRSLIIASRGISHRDRHLMADLRDLLPHSKKDAKFDAKVCWRSRGLLLSIVPVRFQLVADILPANLQSAWPITIHYLIPHRNLLHTPVFHSLTGAPRHAERVGRNEKLQQLHLL